MTFVSCSHWGMFPADPGKLERVAWKMALADCRDNPDDLIATTRLAFGRDRYLKMAQAAIRAYQRYEEKERVTD